MQIEIVSTSGKGPTSCVSTGSMSDMPPPSNGSETAKEKQAADLKKMESMAVDLQETLRVFHNVNLRFSVHEASGQVMVTVTDEDTGETIREIPSQEMLDLSAKIDEMMGLIFDQKI